MKFFYYYIRSMRLYYCFVTGAATLTGVAAHRASSGTPWSGSDAAVLAVGFLSWGVNQIFNDAGNLREDAVNAPHRPMVTGRLPKPQAVMLSAVLMLMLGVVSCMISFWTLLPIAVGVLFNLLYAVLKGVPVLGCAVYGGSIVMCTAYGWIGSSGGLPSGRGLTALATLCLLLLPAHLLMCHNSYFKDVEGDRAAGKRTLQTLCAPSVSLGISTVVSVLYGGLIAFTVFRHGGPATGTAVAGWLALLSFWNLRTLFGKKYHAATLSNCQLCVALNLCFLCRFSAWWLAAAGAAFLAITVIFRWYPDEKE